jgi:hypothetical protein
MEGKVKFSFINNILKAGEIVILMLKLEPENE